MKKLGRFFIVFLQISICFISLFYVLRIFLSNISEIYFYFRTFNLFYLFLSFVLLSLALFLRGEIWAYIIKNLGVKLKENSHYPIYFYPRLATYAPGGIWSFWGQIRLAKKEGISRLKTLISLGVEFIFTFFAGTLLYLVLAFFDFRSSLIFFYLFFLAFLILFLIILPPSLTKIINFIFFLKKPVQQSSSDKGGRQEKLSYDFSYSKVIFLTFAYILYWLLLGGGLIVLVKSLHPVPCRWLPTLINFNTASWIVSFLAPFVAGGLGVMEVILFSFLKGLLPISLASFIPIALRLLSIFSDFFIILMVFISHKFFKLDKKNFDFINLKLSK